MHGEKDSSDSSGIVVGRHRDALIESLQRQPADHRRRRGHFARPGIAIISTPRGYQLVAPAAPGCTRVFVCCHGSDLMEAELNAIVDNGGIVHNVVIEHDVYGNLEGTLNLHSRRDIQQYIKRMRDSHAEMLSTISGGIHTHLVEAATEEELDAISQALRDLGVLYKD